MLMRNEGFSSPPGAFRSVMLLMATVLAAYCLWVVLAELQSPRVRQLPTNAAQAARAAAQRIDGTWAAWSGLIRGDIWAASAFSFADLLWTDANNAEPEQARARGDRAIRYSPAQGDVWLFLADLALHPDGNKSAAAESLRMSYYTAPNQLALMSLRARVVAQLSETDDELKQFAGRDIHILLANSQKQAVIEAYNVATSSGREAIGDQLKQDDPKLLDELLRIRE
jgi:hypothetical protein